VVGAWIRSVKGRDVVEGDIQGAVKILDFLFDHDEEIA
jgi:hypothetical protein